MDTHLIHHDRANRRFELSLEGRKAVAEYEMEGDRMIFTHTWVPPELRGRGLAAELIQSALEFARSNKKNVVPQCSYVEVYLRRHPEFANLLVPPATPKKNPLSLGE